MSWQVQALVDGPGIDSKVKWMLIPCGVRASQRPYDSMRQQDTKWLTVKSRDVMVWYRLE